MRWNDIKWMSFFIFTSIKIEEKEGIVKTFDAELLSDLHIFYMTLVQLFFQCRSWRFKLAQM